MKIINKQEIYDDISNILEEYENEDFENFIGIVVKMRDILSFIANNWENITKDKKNKTTVNKEDL